MTDKNILEKVAHTLYMQTGVVSDQWKNEQRHYKDRFRTQAGSLVSALNRAGLDVVWAAEQEKAPDKNETVKLDKDKPKAKSKSTKPLKGTGKAKAIDVVELTDDDEGSPGGSPFVTE